MIWYYWASVFFNIGERCRKGGALCRRRQTKMIRERNRGTYREEW
jgi:hypothetical protein